MSAEGDVTRKQGYREFIPPQPSDRYFILTPEGQLTEMTAWNCLRNYESEHGFSIWSDRHSCAVATPFLDITGREPVDPFTYWGRELTMEFMRKMIEEGWL